MSEGHCNTHVRQEVSHVYMMLPLIEVLRQYLCSFPTGTIITTSVRRIANTIGRPGGLGSITPSLRRLMADGWIECSADAECTMIEVRRGTVTELPAAQTASSQADHADDHLTQPTMQSIEIQSAAASLAVSNESDLQDDHSNGAYRGDHGHDHQRCKEYIYLRSKGEEDRAPQKKTENNQERAEREAWAKVGVEMPAAQAKLKASRPDLTPERFAELVQRAEQLPGINSPIGFTYSRLILGLSVPQPQEQDHVSPPRQQPARLLEQPKRQPEQPAADWRTLPGSKYFRPYGST